MDKETCMWNETQKRLYLWKGPEVYLLYRDKDFEFFFLDQWLISDIIIGYAEIIPYFCIMPT